jgi:NitT/TauT family transport system permease protein
VLWRPLIAWADRFKVEQTEAAEAPTSAVLEALGQSTVLAWLGARVLHPASERVDRLMGRLIRATSPSGSAQRPPARAGALWRVVGGLAGLALLAAGAGGSFLALGLLGELSLDDWASVGFGAGATFLRVAVALVIGAAWTIPVGVAIGLNPRWARTVQPVVQVVASVPATAVFPVLLLVLVALPGGLNVAAVALMLLGTQWYILFNVIAGAMAIPNDLREAAVVYRLHGWRRWRYLILPGIFPSLVTGMITATGGAWNASVVSEYVTFNQQTLQTVGLGAVIAQSAEEGNFAQLLGATLVMAAVVVALNRLCWHRLYRLAAQRYRLD